MAIPLTQARSNVVSHMISNHEPYIGANKTSDALKILKSTHPGLYGQFQEAVKQDTGGSVEAWASANESDIKPNDLITANYQGAEQAATAQQEGERMKGLLSNDDTQAEVLKRVDAQLQTRLDEIFGQAEKYGLERVKTAFKGPKENLAEQQAATNRFTSPIGAIPEIKLAGQEGAAGADYLGNLAQQRVGGQLDTSKMIESILSGERRAGESMYKFETGLASGKEESALDRSMAKYLGETEAKAYTDASKKTDLEKAMSIISPILSASGSALGGYLGRKK